MVYISHVRVLKDTSSVPFFGNLERDPEILKKKKKKPSHYSKEVDFQPSVYLIKLTWRKKKLT
jgi:hypothetical protein